MAEAVPVFTTTPPRVRRIELDRPWTWLAAGWRDLCRAPRVSLVYGVLFALAGYAITFGLWWADLIYLILPMVVRLPDHRPAARGGVVRGQPAPGNR